MAVGSADTVNSTFEKAHPWLQDLAAAGHFRDEFQAYCGFCTVMHAVRDFLHADAAAHVGAQLPMLIREMYYDRWDPAAVTVAECTIPNFLEYVRLSLNPGCEIDPHTAVHAVFRLLDEKITLGELQNIRQVLPPELCELWPAPPDSAAPMARH